MKYKKQKIRSFCDMEEGEYPALKTKPGSYPLVVTSEERKSANSYQLEGPAICVPIVSSTGHGHASIKRVHYQEGKFALASILVALKPEPKKCEAKYLYHLLMAKKDEVLVPLMRGSANVSLDPDDLLELELLLPSIPAQRQIVQTIEKGREIAIMLEKRNEVANQLIKSIFIKMFGNPQINPKGWNVRKIIDFTDVETGGTPSRKVEKNFQGKIPWIKTTEVKERIIFETEEQITQKALDSCNAKLFDAETVLVAMYGQGKTRGRTAKLGIKAATNQACAAILPSKNHEPDYVWYLLQIMYENLRSLGRGGNQPNLNTGMIKSYRIPLPPIELQKKFTKIVKQFHFVEEPILDSAEKKKLLLKSLNMKLFYNNNES